jgi:hypothetical protein
MLADSPVGLASWFIEKFQRWGDCPAGVGQTFGRDAFGPARPARRRQRFRADRDARARRTSRRTAEHPLGAEDRTQAVTIALQRGIIHLEP